MPRSAEESHLDPASWGVSIGVLGGEVGAEIIINSDECFQYCNFSPSIPLLPWYFSLSLNTDYYCICYNNYIQHTALNETCPNDYGTANTEYVYVVNNKFAEEQTGLEAAQKKNE